MPVFNQCDAAVAELSTALVVARAERVRLRRVHCRQLMHRTPPCGRVPRPADCC